METLSGHFTNQTTCHLVLYWSWHPLNTSTDLLKKKIKKVDTPSNNYRIFHKSCATQGFLLLPASIITYRVPEWIPVMNKEIEKLQLLLHASLIQIVICRYFCHVNPTPCVPQWVCNRSYGRGRDVLCFLVMRREPHSWWPFCRLPVGPIIRYLYVALTYVSYSERL